MDGEYKVVKLNETEIGDYSLGAEKEILRTTTGQINIKGIGEGTYKLVGSDGKELSFNIDENSVSNNIRNCTYFFSRLRAPYRNFIWIFNYPHSILLPP